MDGPAWGEKRDDAIFLELEYPDRKIKSLVDTGASDCFISRETRAQKPAKHIINAWQIDQGRIHLADNSKQIILEQERIRFVLAGTMVCYDLNVVNELCHAMVISQNILAAVKTDILHRAIIGGSIVSRRAPHLW